MKKYADIKSSLVTSDSLREEYIDGKILNIGDSVKTTSGIIGEIINRGPNYVTIVSEGKTTKQWIEDVHPIEIDTPITKSLHKESFIIKGYKTKNFTRELAEQFKAASKLHKDSFALYNCVVSCDTLLGMNENSLRANFDKYRMEYERASKYLKKLNIHFEKFAEIEESLLEFAIMEGVRFSTADKNRVANVIAGAVGFSSKEHYSPHELVNESVRLMKQEKYTPEGWKLFGNILNKATQAGIKWDKSILSPSTSRFMEIE